mmetsp:Transcript_16084/g.29351  ORF Transcript_16084/g.29351 Transcript_16084/m.29351 type:complete len:952 (-) Transcript_16084:3-2858(-)|eukprot:CAMPEP_0205908804 /NCGR_PEP_ID=MMETSP1325-20131115/3453_1 /ASSEMBLY_ACC=CAM_ASM_000708 /TAXON_ID=236786 /ORGANISM="Florenciella sp., Strain RCC1007" /LENGTH=951 /DNA_ID=CAMNT_0053275045 /DNA_START=230 /DNA_END=3085 /DNA_ORIENTATION=-
MKGASVAPTPANIRQFTAQGSSKRMLEGLEPEAPKAPLGTPSQTHHSSKNLDTSQVEKVVETYSKPKSRLSRSYSTMISSGPGRSSSLQQHQIKALNMAMEGKELIDRSYDPNWVDSAEDLEPGALESAQEMYAAAHDRIQSRKDYKASRECVDEQLAYFRQKLKQHWLLLDPDSVFLMRWDLVALLSLLFTAIVTPFETATLEVVVGDGLFVANRVVDFVFILDMVFSFHTAYRTKRSEGAKLVKDLSSIRYHYLRTWFFIDLLSIIPWELIGSGVSVSDDLQEEEEDDGNSFVGIGALKFVRIIRILRMLKLLRIIKASRIYAAYETTISISYAYVSLIKYTILLTLVGHWMACLWIMTARLQPRGSYTWLDDLAYTYYCDPEGTAADDDDVVVPYSRPECPVVAKDMLRPFQMYAAAIYWSITTVTSVGYGDITPKNRDEMLLCTCYILLGSGFWAYIIGNVCGIMSTLDVEGIEHNQIMDALNMFVADRGFDHKLCRRLRAYLHNSKDLAKANRYTHIVERLSPQLQGEVSHESTAWLRKLWFLKTANTEFFVEVAFKIKGGVYEPGERIEWSNSLFSVGKGVASRNGRVRTRGCCWGEDMVLESFELKEPHSAFALTFVEILTLSREHMYDVLEDFEEEKKMVRRACVRMAMKRGILHCAKLIMDRTTRMGTRNDLRDLWKKDKSMSSHDMAQADWDHLLSDVVSSTFGAHRLKQASRRAEFDLIMEAIELSERRLGRFVQEATATIHGSILEYAGAESQQGATEQWKLSKGPTFHRLDSHVDHQVSSSSSKAADVTETISEGEAAGAAEGGSGRSEALPPLTLSPIRALTSKLPPIGSTTGDGAAPGTNPGGAAFEGHQRHLASDVGAEAGAGAGGGADAGTGSSSSDEVAALTLKVEAMDQKLEAIMGALTALQSVAGGTRGVAQAEPKMNARLNPRRFQESTN